MREVLARDVVRYVGETIAVVVAGFAANGRTVFKIWPTGTPRSRPVDLPPRELANAR